MNSQCADKFLFWNKKNITDPVDFFKTAREKM